MKIKETLLEIKAHRRNGYQPVIDYEAWRVAILNYSEELQPENLISMQRHNETDEVFVLLKGDCLLFIGDGKDGVTEIYVETMRPFQIYNVKKGVWHTHALSRDAMVLIVENKDTTYDNSPFCPLSEQQRRIVKELASSAGF